MKYKKEKLLIIGAGGHAASCLEVILLEKNLMFWALQIIKLKI